MNGTSKPYGMIAEFTTSAADHARGREGAGRGFRQWDVFTPFPVHGMDKAMGLKNSKVGWFAFIGRRGRVYQRAC